MNSEGLLLLKPTTRLPLAIGRQVAYPEQLVRAESKCPISRLSPRGVELAERAIKRDRRLSWIYLAQGCLASFPSNPAWSAQVQVADPDNAVPYLFAADALANRHFASLYGHRSPLPREIEGTLASDSAWIALMHRAFQAKRYDSYYLRHVELNRDVWNRYPDLSFSSVMVGLWSHPIPNLLYQDVRTYPDSAGAGTAGGRPRGTGASVAAGSGRVQPEYEARPCGHLKHYRIGSAA
jgi:hypothetical protein